MPWILAVILFTITASPAWSGVPIPHLTANSPEWSDTITIESSDTESREVKLILYREGAIVYEMVHVVHPMQTLRIPIASTGVDPDSGLLEAVDITNTLGLLTYVSYQSEIGGGVAMFGLGTSNVRQSLSFNFSNLLDAINPWKGIAVFNSGENSGQIKFCAIYNGDIVGTSYQWMNPKQKIVALHSYFFPHIPVNMIDKIVAFSDGLDVSGISITGSPNSDKLLFATAANANQAAYSDSQHINGLLKIEGFWLQFLENSNTKKTDQGTLIFNYRGDKNQFGMPVGYFRDGLEDEVLGCVYDPKTNKYSYTEIIEGGSVIVSFELESDLIGNGIFYLFNSYGAKSGEGKITLIRIED